MTATVLGFLLLPALSAAQAQQGRFVMERTDYGFVRLDTFTGEMSVCTEAEGQLICRMAADERRALEEEIGLLEDRLAATETARDDDVGSGQGMLPSEEEIDRTFGVMEQMMRRFLGVIDEFRQETEKREVEPPGPEKTGLR